jgi:PAS domain-containing protein
MTCLYEKPTTKQRTNLVLQLETIQGDLLRLSQFVNQLSGLSDEELEGLEIMDHFETIHHCLNRFEARCLSIQVTAYENEFVVPVDEDSIHLITPANNNWTTTRREAKHANKLASQLTHSLGKIRAGLGQVEGQGSVPEEIVQINQVVGNTISELATDWFTNLA